MKKRDVPLHTHDKDNAVVCTAAVSRHMPLLPVLLSLLTLLLLPLQALEAKGGQLFPTYSVIQANVDFWEKVYATYPSTRAIVHDNKNLALIYEIIPIVKTDLPGAHRLNSRAFKNAKYKYRKILTKLSRGSKPRTATERRVAAMFTGTSRLKKMKAAAGSIRVQVGQKDRFIAGIIRSGAYIKEIKRILRSQGLPEDLAYLPHVESSFNLKAYSRIGAAGIWQFTRATGKQYLNINYEMDERRDPLLASHAAAKLLKRNYRLLKTWPLAITAYNYGSAGMKRAVASHGSYPNIFKGYRKGYFKFASRNFYSEFLAARKVAKRLEKKLAHRQDKPVLTRTVALKGYLHLDTASRYFNVDKKKLEQLNPALLSPVLSGKKYIPKGYGLRLPAGSTTNRLVANMGSSLYKSSQKKSAFHRVKRGDTVSSIARLHRVSQASLARANNLGRKRTIYAGQKLRIPGAPSSVATTIKETKKRLPSRVAQTKPPQRVVPAVPVLKPADKKRRVVVGLTQPANTAPPARLKVHSIHQRNGQAYGKITVQHGESLAMFATWLRTSISSIRRLNNLSHDEPIQQGQILKLAFTHINSSTFERKRAGFHRATEESFFNSYAVVGVKKYQISKGDTLWEICRKKFDLPVWLLKKYNSGVNLNQLKYSQNLNIPIVKAI